jgi:hypothetical protein
MIKQCGNGFTDIYFDMNLIDATNNEEIDRNLLINSKIKTLSLIVKQCTILKTLELYNMPFNRDGSPVSITEAGKSVERLSIEETHNIHPKTMTQLSQCLPSLRYPIFDNSCLATEKSSRNGGFSESYYVDMPNTRFENIKFNMYYLEMEGHRNFFLTYN